MATVGIALGTNLGERVAQIQSARNLLSALTPNNSPFLQSSLYQSSPVNCPEGSPDFLNTTIEMVFEGSVQQLLRKTQSIEQELGRISKAIANSPRPIDIDILYFDNLITKTPQLIIPHPRLHQRRFVLQPLTEICPDRILPNQTLTISELLETLRTDEPPLTLTQTHW